MLRVIGKVVNVDEEQQTVDVRFEAKGSQSTHPSFFNKVDIVVCLHAVFGIFWWDLCNTEDLINILHWRLNICLIVLSSALRLQLYVFLCNVHKGVWNKYRSNSYSGAAIGKWLIWNWKCSSSPFVCSLIQRGSKLLQLHSFLWYIASVSGFNFDIRTFYIFNNNVVVIVLFSLICQQYVFFSFTQQWLRFVKMFTFSLDYANFVFCFCEGPFNDSIQNDFV